MIEAKLVWAFIAAFLAMLVFRRLVKPRQPNEYEQERHKVLHHPEYRVKGRYE